MKFLLRRVFGRIRSLVVLVFLIFWTFNLSEVLASNRCENVTAKILNHKKEAQDRGPKQDDLEILSALKNYGVLRSSMSGEVERAKSSKLAAVYARFLERMRSLFAKDDRLLPIYHFKNGAGLQAHLLTESRFHSSLSAHKKRALQKEIIENLKQTIDQIKTISEARNEALANILILRENILRLEQGLQKFASMDKIERGKKSALDNHLSTEQVEIHLVSEIKNLKSSNSNLKTEVDFYTEIKYLNKSLIQKHLKELHSQLSSQLMGWSGYLPNLARKFLRRLRSSSPETLDITFLAEVEKEHAKSWRIAEVFYQTMLSRVDVESGWVSAKRSNGRPVLNTEKMKLFRELHELLHDSQYFPTKRALSQARGLEFRDLMSFRSGVDPEISPAAQRFFDSLPEKDQRNLSLENRKRSKTLMLAMFLYSGALRYKITAAVGSALIAGGMFFYGFAYDVYDAKVQKEVGAISQIAETEAKNGDFVSFQHEVRDYIIDSRNLELGKNGQFLERNYFTGRLNELPKEEEIIIDHLLDKSIEIWDSVIELQKLRPDLHQAIIDKFQNAEKEVEAIKN